MANNHEGEINKSVDGLVKGFHARFIAGVNEVKESIQDEALIAAMAAQDELAAQNAITLEGLEAKLKASQAEYMTGIHEGGTIAIKHLPKGAEIGKPVFDLLDPIVVDHAAKHSAKLVVEVTQTTGDAIRWRISEALVKDLHPKTAAKYIREIVGLTTQQAKAVDRRRDSMIASGVPEKTAQKAAARHADKLLKYRANLIAETEMSTAVNYGVQQAWEQLDDKNELTDMDLIRQWRTAADESVCSICGPMHMQERKISEPFMTGDGRTVMIPGREVHPGDRCNVILKFKDTKS